MNSGQFQPGNPKPPNSGRKKGTGNKRNAAVNDKLTDIVLARMHYLTDYMDEMHSGKLSNYSTDMLLKLLPLTMPKNITYEASEDEIDADTQAQDHESTTA